MESKHTPGPWKSVPTRNRDHWSDILDAKDRPVAMVHNRTNEASFDVEIANGRLLTAAPDLLAALEALCNECDKASSDLLRANMGISAQSLGMTAHAARAAIVKATGGGE